jgi:hypothetical protein
VTIAVASQAFEQLATEVARDLGLPRARRVTVPHPIGGVRPEELDKRADRSVDGLIRILQTAAR